MNPNQCLHYGPCGLVQKHGVCIKDAHGIHCGHDSRLHQKPDLFTPGEIEHLKSIMRSNIGNGCDLCADIMRKLEQIK